VRVSADRPPSGQAHAQDRRGSIQVSVIGFDRYNLANLENGLMIRTVCERKSTITAPASS
jgi:hypothetical protein